MSEYQYYEFQAIDRPLTEPEMAELRVHSTRARIPQTSFVNDYSRGDEDARTERCCLSILVQARMDTNGRCVGPRRACGQLL